MKKIILMLAFIMPATVFAQKFGHVDTQSVLQSMPEITKAEADVKAQSQTYENELKAMQEEFQRKYDEYEKTASTMNDTKRKETEQSLTEMQQKIQQTYNDHSQALQKLQQEKLQPIYAKVNTAIENVGKAGGYTYIFEKGAALYVGPGSKDVTSDVKAEVAKIK